MRIEPLVANDTVTHYTPGGGGYGDPLQRDPASVRRDVRAGFVSVAAARAQYGVRLNPQSLEVVEFLR